MRKGSGVSTIRYRSGLKIPKSGIYRVFHREHQLPGEVTLLEGESFPGCSECGAAINFQLIREANVDPEGFHVTLHQIPPITPAQAAAIDEKKKAA